jgi:DNA polymerase-3 subunit chi
MSARADFYLIVGERFRAQPLLLVAKLAQKAFAGGQPTLVLARDQAQAEALDDQLWDMGEDEFIPHQIAGSDEDDAEADVLIVPPGVDTPMRPLVINLRDEPVAGDFVRVLEVVPADESARGPLRERWRQYQARGLVVNKHDM